MTMLADDLGRPPIASSLHPRLPWIPHPTLQQHFHRRVERLQPERLAERASGPQPRGQGQKIPRDLRASALKPKGFTSKQQELCSTSALRLTSEGLSFDHSGKDGEFCLFEYTGG